MLQVLAPAQLLPRRTLAVAAIVLLHVTVAYYLATGLIRSVVAPQDASLHTTVSIERAPPLPPPAAPPPRHLQPNFSRAPPAPGPLPPPAPPAATPAEDPGLTLQVPPPAPPLAAELRVLGQNVLPASADYYPPAKIRAGIEGAPIVRVCVDPLGLRSGEPVLEQTSGDAELDRGALNMARHGRYARAEQGGVPVANCYRFHVTFRIR